MKKKNEQKLDKNFMAVINPNINHIRLIYLLDTTI